jgi:6-phosphogluconolactonase
MKMLRYSLFVASLVSVVGFGAGFAAFAQAPPDNPDKHDDYFMYLGTYTGHASKGIYAYRFQPSTGKLTPMGAVATTPSPSYLVIHPNGRFLYAANENDPTIPDGKDTYVSAFAINQATGQLTFLNNMSSHGGWPCHVSLDKTGSTLFVANYANGTVASYPILADGKIGSAATVDPHKGKSVNPERQAGPHAHFLATSPDNRFALSADLGLDQVLIYHFDPATSRLTPNNPPFASLKPGTGPRHLAFSPDGKFAYVNGEMDSTVTTFAYDASAGTLKSLQTVSTLPAAFKGTNSTAEIAVDKAGKFLFVSNRGDDSIAIFSIEKATGLLTAAGHVPTGGKTPRFFTLDPTEKFLFAGNQDSNTVTVFRANIATAKFTPMQTLKDVPEAVSIVFVPVKH